MSYTRPKFIREDYGAFNRNLQASFDKSFGEMKEYFDDKIKQRQEYVADVNAQAEEMRTEGTNIEEFATKTQEQIEEEVQKFISSALTVTDKEGRSVDDEGFKAGFFSQNIQEKKMSQRKMDEVNASFTNAIKGQDAITEEAFVKMLDLHDDYDKSSPGYQKFAGAISGLRGGWKEGGHMKVKFDEKTGKFTSNLAIPNPDFEPKMIGGKPNPRWYEGVNEGVEEELNYTSGELQSLLAGNDSSLRANHEEAVHGKGGVIETIKGQVLTDLKASKASGESYVAGTLGPEQGAAYLAPTAINKKVDIFMAESRASDENNPNAPSVVDGIFANNVNFNTNLRLDLLGGGETDTGEVIEGVEGGAELIAAVEGIVDTNIYSGIVTPDEKEGVGVHTTTKIQGQEILADILDMPAGDIKNRKKDLARLYDLTNPGGSEEDKQKWIDTQEQVIKNFRDAASRRYITNELLAEGIGSEWIRGRKKEPTTPSAGGTPDKGPDYSQKKFNEIGNALGGTAVGAVDDDSFVGPQTAMLQDTDFETWGVRPEQKQEIESIFSNMKMETKDGDRMADDVNFNPSNKTISFKYDAKRNVKLDDGSYDDLPDSTVNYDLSDPLQFEKLYLNIGIKATGAKPGMGYETDYAKMASVYGKQNFFTHLMDQGSMEVEGEGNLVPASEGMLGKGNMSKWVTKTLKEDPDFVYNSLAGIENHDQWETIRNKPIITRNGIKTTMGEWYDIRKQIKASRQ